MFRLTIRELMLVIIAVAFAIAWFIDHRRLTARFEEAVYSEAAWIQDYGANLKQLGSLMRQIEKLGYDVKMQQDGTPIISKASD